MHPDWIDHVVRATSLGNRCHPRGRDPQVPCIHEIASKNVAGRQVAREIVRCPSDRPGWKGSTSPTSERRRVLPWSAENARGQHDHRPEQCQDTCDGYPYQSEWQQE